jgi:hypothetical protein
VRVIIDGNSDEELSYEPDWWILILSYVSSN